MFNSKDDPVEIKYSEAEAAKKLGFKARITLYRLRRKGKIGYYILGQRVYYGHHHLADYLANCERGARTRKTRAEV